MNVLWNYIQAKENREFLAFVFGGLAVVIAGVWAVYTRFSDTKDKTVTNELLKAMTQQILALSSTESMPGTERRVGEAIGAIAKGAADGDEQLQKALDLLRANKIADAAQLLQAVAEEKTARIKKDSKHASIAYRNLGAIAGLGNPKQALDAYRKAIELDPNDSESLLVAGWIELERGDIDEAERHFLRLLMLMKTNEVAPGRYWATLGLGDIQKQRGNLLAALKSYRDALAIVERLVMFAPGDTGHRRDLSVSHNRVGDVMVAQGDQPGALKSYHHALAIAERLAQSDPQNTEWQRDLSISHNKIGDVLKAQNDLAGALKRYRKALDIIECLAKSEPGNARWQRDLSVSYDRIRAVLDIQDDWPEAQKFCFGGLSIAKRLAQSDPENAEWQRDLSVSYNNVGDVLFKQSDWPGALKYYGDGLAIRESLAQSKPSNAAWQRDLSVSYDKIGDVLVKLSNRPGALEFYHKGLAIRENLTKSDPDNVEWQVELLSSHWRLAEQGDDAAQRWALIVTHLRILATENKLTAKHARLLPAAEEEWAKLKPR